MAAPGNLPPDEAGPSQPQRTSAGGPKPTGEGAPNGKALPAFEEFTRPPYRPLALPPSTPCILTTPSNHWIIAHTHNVHFALSHFAYATKDLILHPERNSSLILRADPLPPKETDEIQFDEEARQLGLERIEEVRVRLMPKQPNRDGKLDQRVTWYRDNGQGSERGLVVSQPEIAEVGDLPFYYPPVRKIAYIYEPVVEEHNDGDTNGDGNANANANGDVKGSAEDNDDALEPPIRGRISIAYLPFSSPVDNPANGKAVVNPLLLGVRPSKPARKRSPLAAAPLTTDTPNTVVHSNGDGQVSGSIKPPATVYDYEKSVSPPIVEITNGETTAKSVEEKVGKICRVLLERVYRFGYGNMTGYRKRIFHDVVINRESFQDLYLVLKDRYRHLDSRAPKANSTNPKIEDVKRHVWKSSDASLPSDPSLPSELSHWGSQDVAIATFLILLWKEMYPPQIPDPSKEDGGEVRENDTWGRPPGGFVDLGCGNGLLVHVLTSEGYAGKGYELRQRRTWPLYPPETRDALIEMPISFPTWFPDTLEEWRSGSWEGKDLCPIREGCFIIGNHADEITPWIPLLSLIPSTPVPYLSLPCCLHTLDGSFTTLNFSPPEHPHTPPGGFEKGLEDGQSRYKAYLMWLGWVGLKCGWKWEKEGLRIPSTKGWGIIARERWTIEEEDNECRRWALEQVQGVRERGVFKIRVKEGAERDH